MQEGLAVKAVKEGLLVLLTVAAEFEVLDVLGIVVGMEAADARKAVRTWKITSFHTVFDPLVFMIFFAWEYQS